MKILNKQYSTTPVCISFHPVSNSSAAIGPCPSVESGADVLCVTILQSFLPEFADCYVIFSIDAIGVISLLVLLKTIISFGAIELFYQGSRGNEFR